jgi:hypothetical protein
MRTAIDRRHLLLAVTGLPFCITEANAHAADAPKPDQDGWMPLFDGETLGGWKKTEFAGGGEVKVEKDFRKSGPAIVLGAGERLSGFNWTKEVPKTNYELSLEAIKTDGRDFFLGLTFPVGDSFATLIVGGWGGSIVGISSIDNSDASENATTKYLTFEKDRWYKVRLKVTKAKIEAWLDDKQVVDADIVGKKVSLRPGDISQSVPLGIATYRTDAAYRAIKVRSLK